MNRVRLISRTLPYKKGPFMAIITQDYFCPAIGMATELRAVIPDAALKEVRRPGSTLFLLSPEGSSGSDWITSTKLKVLCDKYDTAAVLVPCLQGCYTNMVYGYRFYDSLRYSREYIETYLPGIDVSDGHIAAAGVSAGGAAALRWAMEEPDAFSACASFSGLLDPSREEGGWFTQNRMLCLYGDQGQREEAWSDFLTLCRETAQTRCYIFSANCDPGYGDSLKAAEFLEKKALMKTGEGTSDWKTWSDVFGEFMRWWKGEEG